MRTVPAALKLFVLAHWAPAPILASATGRGLPSRGQTETHGECFLQHQSTVKRKAGGADGGRVAAKQPAMKVKKAVFENRCTKPVYLYGVQDGVPAALEIQPHVTEEFNETRGFVPWRDQRITLSFGNFYGGRSRPPNLDASVIELNADYMSFTVPKSHISFISQLGFSDLNLEVALWKDKIHGTLAVEGGNPACFSRAKTTFKVSDCSSLSDGSGRVLQRSWGELCMPVCPSTGLASEQPCDTSCFVEAGTPVEYARYCSHRSLSFKWGRWRQSPATVDLHLRECSQQWSPTFECWDNQDGPEGFPICDGPDARELPDELGVWQVVACPDLPSLACESSNVSDDCKRDLDWAMQHGINLYPNWYPGLTPASPREDFQRLIYERAGSCPEPCVPGVDVEPPPKCDHLPTQCVDDVRWAMHYGIFEHPEWYGDLTPQSPQVDFQRFVSRVRGTCPDPDQDKAGEPGEVEPPCEELSEACLRDLNWAMDVGIKSNPSWYPGLTPESPKEAFQQVVHDNLGTCPAPCDGVATAA